MIGDLPAGARNSIADVAGVTVGHSTVISDDNGVTARTGVTVIRPRPGYTRNMPLFAAPATLNGNGEMTGLEWVRESGLLTTDIALTGTHSVGVVRDAMVALDASHPDFSSAWSLPVVGETSDLPFNSGAGQHVTADHVRQAHQAASADFAEGAVGGGTGMVCHGFKGGIGTASRIVCDGDHEWTVGVLVQANHGTRRDLRVDGFPVGRSSAFANVPLPGPLRPPTKPGLPPGAGSIIVIVATDAPLLPGQCGRLAARVSLGIGRVGGGIGDSSGDIFFAFTTGSTNILPERYGSRSQAVPVHGSVPHQQMDELFRAVVEATEESILNAMLAARTLTGVDGFTAHGLDSELLLEAMGELR